MSGNTDIQELSNFLLDFATTLMAVGSHTSRVVRNVTRIADSFGYGVDMTVFQRNITMTIKHRDDYSIRRTYVRRIPAAALNIIWNLPKCRNGIARSLPGLPCPVGWC